jgi:catechol 2,3-dioxygenase-like lactoylglutathione lyase family enzyme
MSVESKGRVLRFAGFRRAVSSLDRALGFYVGALGFAVTRTGDRSAQLALGEESIELFSPLNFEAPSADGPAASVASAGFQHLAIVTPEMDAALHRLDAFAPRAISRGGAVLLPRSSGGVRAFKFRDLDGHPLELIEFPAGVGDPRWHRADRHGPTLGFDHSAISVGDTTRSLAFYQTGLGLELGARQLNRGEEQARLDGCAEAEVEVIALEPSRVATPHLELLGYRTPAPLSRPTSLPIGEDHSDRITFVVDDLRAVLGQLRSIRPGLSTLDSSDTVQLRDDDGHMLLLQQALHAPPEPMTP